MACMDKIGLEWRCTLMNLSTIFPKAHTTACSLVISATIALLFSPVLTNMMVLLLIILILFSKDLRGSIARSWQQPLVRAALAFYAIVSLGVVYSVASFQDALSMWWGWRKLLLLPLALALFDDPGRKLQFLLIFVGVVASAAIASFFVWFTGYTFPFAPGGPGVLLRNHATQGMMFAVAAFAAIVLSTRLGSSTTRWLLIACAVLLAANIAFVTPGRSGFLVLLICAIAATIGFLCDTQYLSRKKALIGSGIMLVAVVSGLAWAPNSRDRIAQALHEMQHYQQQKEITSMGIRVHFWINTLDLMQTRPIFGYGTGAFGTAYAQVTMDRPGLASVPTADPHNQYMKVGVEHGLIGLLVFLAMLITAFRQRVSSPFRLLGLGVLAAWASTSLANSHFSTFNEGTFIYIWLGIMLAEKRPTIICRI